MEPNKTVRVRIAVAVSASGQWVAEGYTRGNGDSIVRVSDEQLARWAGSAENMHGARAVHFIEADIPLPVAQTIEGKVAP